MNRKPIHDSVFALDTHIHTSDWFIFHISPAQWRGIVSRYGKHQWVGWGGIPHLSTFTELDNITNEIQLEPLLMSAFLIVAAVNLRLANRYIFNVPWALHATLKSYVNKTIQFMYLYYRKAKKYLSAISGSL